MEFILNPYLSKKIKIISFLSMVMVVFLHSYNIIINMGTSTVRIHQGFNMFFQEIVSYGFTRTAVPIFFLISGLLFFKNFNGTLTITKVFSTKIERRIKSLFIPYVFWSLFGILVFLTLQSVPFSKPFFTKELISEYSFDKLLLRIFINPIPYQLWFIRDLLLLVFVSPILYFLLKKASYISIILMCFCWIFEYDLIILSNESLLFFSLGTLIAINNLNVNIIVKKRTILVGAFIWNLLIIAKVIGEYMELNSSFLIMLYKASIVLGVLVIWFIYDIIFCEIKLSKNITDFTFFIFVFHEPLLTILKKGFYFLFGISEISSFLIYIFAPIIAIITSIGVGNLLKKYTSSFYKIITGNR